MILVTGGAGFIGSALVAELNSKGVEDIIIVDRLGLKDKWKNLSGLKYADFIHADELFTDEYELHLNRIKEIYHFGACSSTVEKDADYLFKNNWEFSKKLFLYATHNNIKLCYASSAATYGDGEEGYDDSHELVEKFRPLNAYGYSKQYFDQWLLSQKRHPKYWYGIKFFNVYGPNEYHKDFMASVVFKSFHQVKNDKLVKLFKSYKPDYADGEQKRDFVYVKDAVRAIIELMEKECTSGIYNMGTGTARTFVDLAKSVFTALDIAPNIEFIEMPDHVKGQYQYFTEANIDKLKAALPGFNFHSLEDGVKDYVQNYLDTNRPHMSK